jgi:hypothetical protein
MMKTIHERIENEILERIRYLEVKIEEFGTPITEEDYADHFKSRLSGDKSARALREYYDELLQRNEELMLIRNYDVFYQRSKL